MTDDVPQQKAPLDLEQAFTQARKEQAESNDEKAAEIYRAIIGQAPKNMAAKYLLSTVDKLAGMPPHSGVARKFILEAFRRYSTYESALPYNLNWMLDDTSVVGSILADNPLVVMDVGARGRHLAELEGLRKHIVYYGFDADREACEQMMASPPSDFRDYKIIPQYVGSENGSVDFHIYKMKDFNSRLKPSESFRKRFDFAMAIERTVQVESATLDDIKATYGLKPPDVIKLDTQGTELEILTASPDCLSKALLVEVEVEFVEMYEGQPLFHDVAAFMYGQGFELLYLNRVFQSRWQYRGLSRGQHTFADALFGLRDDLLDTRSTDDLARYAVLLINYGHADIAYDIWRASPALQQRYPNLEQLFPPWPPKEERKAVMNLEKILLGRLHARRTNQFPMDSDRSWPVR